VPDFPGEAERLVQAKTDLRRRLLTARKTLSPASLTAAAAGVQAATTAWVRAHAPRCVAAYVPMAGEPGGPSLPTSLLSALPPGGRLLLPVLLPDNDLTWADFSGPLSPGRLGLLEPPGPRLGVAAVASADLVIVPALAVDHRGTRLGRGGGSYDRALARVDPARTVALLHDGELLPEIPAAAHDRPVAAVVTPGGGWSPIEWTK
jgi:5-formyltetrahydrofolate cyclo-ligase